jgi:hypothetical protein
MANGIAEAVGEIRGTPVSKVSGDGTALVAATRPGLRRPKACYQERCEGEQE